MPPARERAASALSVSSGEIDRQLDDLSAKAANKTTSGEFSGEKTRQDAKEKGREEEEEGQENVSVIIRCRPLSTSEQKSASESCVQVDEANKSVQVTSERRQFFYDQVFGDSSSNERVYMRSARRLVDAAFAGFNCTIFLYGQTGTGKTYTHSSLTQSAFEHLFALIQDSDKQARFLIRASYYELYNEEIRDLLAPAAQRRPASSSTSSSKTGGAAGGHGLELRESKERGVYVKDLTCFLVSNLAELSKLKRLGDKRRSVAATKMNEHSSRSHSIFSITIETTSSISSEATSTAKGDAGKSKKSATSGRQASRVTSAKQQQQQQQQQLLRLGRLHLIDLAGSERQSKSGSSGQQLKEASRINLSLTCLSLVIRALTDKTNAGGGGGHVPYRNSKLTRLLSSSLGGNSKTLLIACISPARSSLDETLNTLRFASRTKQIKNRAVINEDPKDALLRKYKRQLEELRAKLSERQQQANGKAATSSTPPGDLDTPPPEEKSSLRHRDQRQQQQQQREQMSEQEQQLVQQLEMLKAKIMFGGENLLDKVELHERLLAASRQELEERQAEEAKLREQLASRRDAIERVSKSKGSLESQRLQLDERLRRALALYKQSKFELRDLSSEHEQLKEQLLQTVRSTRREIRYADCMLNDFIPHDQLELINNCARYDEESDEWQIKYIALSGNNMAQTRRGIGASSLATLVQTPVDS